MMHDILHSYFLLRSWGRRPCDAWRHACELHGAKR